MTRESSSWKVFGFSSHSEEPKTGFALPVLSRGGDSDLYVQVKKDQLLDVFDLQKVDRGSIEVMQLDQVVYCSPEVEQIICFITHSAAPIAGGVSETKHDLMKLLLDTDLDTAIRLQIAEILGSQDFARSLESRFVNEAISAGISTIGLEASIGASALFDIIALNVRRGSDPASHRAIAAKASRVVRGWNVASLSERDLREVVEACGASVEALQAALDARRPLHATNETLQQPAKSLTTEYQISLCVLQIAGQSDDLVCSFKKARQLIPNMIPLTPYDLSKSPTQGRPRWHQRLNNIQSNHKTPRNFIRRGLLEHVRGIGYRATAAGMNYLRDFKAHHSAAAG